MSILRTTPSNPPLPHEELIIINLGLQSIIHEGLKKDVRATNLRDRCWQLPPQGFFKVNIDGASKGNSREPGFGGAIRDLEGHTKFIFHSHLDEGTNNMAELLVLDQCLEIMVETNIYNVIKEANSELVIKAAKKIQNGTFPK